MFVLSQNLMKHYGLEGLHHTGQKQVILPFYLFIYLFLDILSAPVGSPGHGEALSDWDKEHQSIKPVAFYDVPVRQVQFLSDTKSYINFINFCGRSVII